MKKQAFKAALPYTLPICFGFLFLGMSYGFLMHSKGFPFVYPLFMSLFIFAGSMEFVTVNLLLSAFHPLSAFLLALMVNARHLIYGMCDESFSINCAVTPPPEIDRGWFMFFVTLLNHIYWVSGATLGALLGYVIHFDTTGIEFVMTALFVVMLVGQWEEADDHRPALTGIVCSLVCLLLFGGDRFMLPAMALIVLCFSLGRHKIARKEKEGARS